nr:thermonuclease family protein [Nitrosospira sp. Nsp13]
MPQVKDRYEGTVARIKCDGVDANAEQVKRGMAWVYRQYAKDHTLNLLEHKAKVERRGCGLTVPLSHPGNSVN